MSHSVDVKTSPNLEQLIKDFQIFMGTEKGRRWSDERKRRTKLYQRLLSLSHIDHLNEVEFSSIIKSLWASNIWTNKDWLVEKILEENGGIENIRTALKGLLYGSESLAERYDSFARKIKRMGPSMITEILAFSDPRRYCIWNEKPKAVLPFLKMEESLPDRVFKYQITGREYEECLKVLSKIRESLKTIIEDPDFIDVDFFLAFIFYEILPAGQKEKPRRRKGKEITIERPRTITINSHKTAQYALIELGNLLGFDTYVAPEDRSRIVEGRRLCEIASLKELPQFTYPRLLDTVRHIDVIWFKEEFPKFCFEVEEKTDVTKGLLRLYQVRQLDVIPIVVGPESKRRKFLVEIEKDPFYRVKSKYKFISYEELAQLLKTTKEFFNLKKRLLGE